MTRKDEGFRDVRQSTYKVRFAFINLPGVSARVFAEFSITVAVLPEQIFSTTNLATRYDLDHEGLYDA